MTELMLLMDEVARLQREAEAAMRDEKVLADAQEKAMAAARERSRVAVGAFESGQKRLADELAKQIKERAAA